MKPALPTKRALVPLLAGSMLASTLYGCPSLDAIGVGGPDAGTDATHDAHRTTDATDARSDAKGCAPDAADAMGCGEPYAIATMIPGPYGVAVQDGVIYFTTSDLSLDFCNVDDCENTLMVLTSSQALPRSITTDQTNVYWANAGFPPTTTNPGSIATCGLSGCTGEVAEVLASPEGEPVDLAVDSTAVYWTDDDGGLVRSCTVGGCGNMPTTLAKDSPPLSGVAIDDTSIYWAEVKPGNIIQCPLSGCMTFPPFATGQNHAAKIDVTQGVVYWSANDAIMSCPSAGCKGKPQVFASDQPSSFAITHDATNLYWTLFQEDGQVLSCPLEGCKTPKVLAMHQNLPTSVAVDDTSVYWASSGANAIMRVSK